MYHTSQLRENDEFDPSGIVTEEYGVLPVGSSGKVTKVTQVSKHSRDDILSLHLLIPKSYFELEGLPVPEADGEDDSIDDGAEGNFSLQHGRVPVDIELPRSEVEIVLIDEESTPVAEWVRSQHL